MKVGDLVKYNRRFCAVVLYVNEAGGTVQAIDMKNEIRWLVTSGCEVISESR
jgi:hypothetical protein